ncbi:DNA helicase RecQ [Pseudoroseicyclus sp. H15]
MADGSNLGAEQLLHDIFGFTAFRPGQAEIVSAVAAGEDVLAIMPTGGGKSLCYQLPALMRGGVTLVISPLIALMRDQVRALREAGVEAGALTSGNTPEETDAVWAGLEAGTLRLLYMAPERLAAGGVPQMLRRAGVGLIAVDEAHCVSQWGHDFRPDYLRIGELKRALDVPLAAFTATADEETREEIGRKLFEAPPRTFLRGFDRPNIHLAFAAKDGPRRQILDFASARKGQSGIVYCGTRAKTEGLADALNKAGIPALAYHGGMEADQRREGERRFQQEDGLVVAATIAFGMGVDKPDIRWVAHADLPKSIEGYYQEIGRAGRDGAPAETLTLFGPDDIRYRRQQIDEGLAPDERKAADHGRLNALLGLAEALGCRRQVLLSYFGETLAEPCGNCDLCDAPPDVFDGTEPVRMALSAALRSEERFGSGHLIDILRGTATDKVTQWRHDALPTFGVGAKWSKAEWQAIFRQMQARDLIRPDPSRHGALRMTEAARPVLRGEATVTLRRDSMTRASKPTPRVREMVKEEDAPLLSALKAKRRALAEAQGLPAYMIFTDKTLIEMAEARPSNMDQIARINGVGGKKLAKYGADFLQVIAGEAEELHPRRMKLAGRDAGALYDRLQEAALALARGPAGTDKPMSLPAAALSRVAETRPADLPALSRLIGERATERFGPAFLEILLAE